jgi:hypothetical protein
VNRKEFEAITRDHLLDDWGDKAYPPTALAKLWRIVGSIAGGELRSALEQLSLTCTRAPSLAQIRAACFPAIQRAREHDRSEGLLHLPACLHCDRSGWVFAVRRHDPTIEVGFICTLCTAAKVRGIGEGHGAGFWRADLERTYIPRLATAANLEAMNALQKQANAAAIVRRRGKVGAPINDDLIALANQFLEAARQGALPYERPRFGDDGEEYEL